MKLKTLGIIALLMPVCVVAITKKENGNSVENTWSGSSNGGVVYSLPSPKKSTDTSLYTTLDNMDEMQALKIRTTQGAILFDANSDFSDNGDTYSASKIDNTGESRATILKGDYHSFGIWETGRGTSSGSFGAISVGQETQLRSLPIGGKAVYTGNSCGNYVSSNTFLWIFKYGERFQVDSDLKMVADFTNRSIDFKTTNTTLYPDDVNREPFKNDNLNLSGTLSLEKNANVFSGSVSSSGGTLSGEANGKFYGPNAEQVGGIFSLTGDRIETYNGAFGGER